MLQPSVPLTAISRRWTIINISRTKKPATTPKRRQIQNSLQPNAEDRILAALESVASFRSGQVTMLTQWIRRIVATTLLLGAGFGFAYAADIFSSVTARSMGDEIVVQWTTGEELGIGGFIIERSDQETPAYRRMGYIQARGTGNRYTYVDNTAFSKPTEQKQYTYRIKGVNGLQVLAYSRPVSTFHDVSSVTGKSWGVIKDLFR